MRKAIAMWLIGCGLVLILMGLITPEEIRSFFQTSERVSTAVGTESAGTDIIVGSISLLSGFIILRTKSRRKIIVHQ